MKQVMTVFSFTMRDGMRKKAFRISTVLILLLILGLCSLPRLLGSTEPDVSAPPVSAETTKTCYVIDENGLIPGAAEALHIAFTDTEFVAGQADNLAGYKADIAENPALSLIEITKTDGTPSLNVITKDFMSGINAAGAAETLSRAYVKVQLAAQGVSESAVDLSPLPYTAAAAGHMELSGYILGILLIVLMFYAVYYYGYGVSMSVATEKTSRVMETLVVSAKPSRILIGKCLGMGALGLIQFSVILLFSAFCYQLLIPADFLLMGMPLSLSAFTVSSAVLVLVYFVLGYSLYAVMNAVSGALVSKIEDLNSAMMPVMLIAGFTFVVSVLPITPVRAGVQAVMRQAASSRRKFCRSRRMDSQYGCFPSHCIR